jgi:enoyl-CoA hydratase
MNVKDFETILLEKRDGIAYLTLNRPEVMNALNARMAEELTYAWLDLKNDEDVQVIILTGAGEAFQQGMADIDALKASLESTYKPPTHLYRYSFDSSATPRSHELFKPIVVAVNGICATSGLEQVSEGDIIICSENATFYDNHVSYGGIVHSAVNLSKKMPYNHVIRMALMGEHEIIDAKRAYEIGLVSEVTTPERLIPRAEEIAKTIMLNAPTAVQASIEVMWNSMSLGLKDAMNLSCYMARYYQRHPDRKEWIWATIEHRRPRWMKPHYYDAVYDRVENKEK